MGKAFTVLLGGLAACLAFLFAILTLNPAAAFEGLLIATTTGLAAVDQPSADARGRQDPK